ncbi:MAG TPA: HAMP domain-containing sensor histidine kinase [Bryobacteraceae bacterium]|nr:HAMP domain-containing sensor histidine kinase [Bryobacteraceae bacterium]
MSLRTRLALVFIAATLIPLGATVWVTTALLDRSLRLSPVDQLSGLSRSLEKTGREYYQQACEQLKADALAGRATPAVAPAAIADFEASDEGERFVLTGNGGSQLLYLMKTPEGVTAWQRPLAMRMQDLSRQYSDARRTVSSLSELRRGFFFTWGLLAAAIWLVALSLVWLAATRFSRPIVKLTEALKSLAAGDFRIRVPTERTDEIGLATEAFNRTASQLEHSRDRLVYLTQLASWQVLARKTAHEVKNSLTPIRLTVEEMVARSNEPDKAFLETAAGIVVDEIESLERRIRAFSEFSSEPPVCPQPLDLHQLVEERIAFLKSAHPEVRYAVEVAESTPSALADEDLVKGILVNLLENAAEAAGDGGQILTRVCPLEDRVAIEVHDSGPGLSEMARTSLFQPTISFKKRGMGLGLSIARKSALLSGGDILLIAGELGGAGFRVLLPGVNGAVAAHSGR